MLQWYKCGAAYKGCYKTISVELDSGQRATRLKIPKNMIKKKRKLHLSYSQAFGVARIYR